MRLRANREDVNKNSESKDRPRKFGARIRRDTKRVVRNAIFVSSLLISGLMLSGKANAEDNVVKQPDKALSVRVMGGAYNKGQDPYIGVGLSGHLGYEHVKFDATVDGIFKDFKKAELDHVELDITFPIKNEVAFSPFIYRSAYFGNVELGSGVMIHIPKINLHICPHWFKSGNTNGFPVPIVWTPSVGGKLGLLFKITPIVNHAALVKSNGVAPLIGGEIKMTFKLADGVKIYGKVFEMTARNKDGDMFVGAASAQTGVEMSF